MQGRNVLEKEQLPVASILKKRCSQVLTFYCYLNQILTFSLGSCWPSWPYNKHMCFTLHSVKDSSNFIILNLTVCRGVIHDRWRAFPFLAIGADNVEEFFSISWRMCEGFVMT